MNERWRDEWRLWEESKAERSGERRDGGGETHGAERII